MHKALTIAGSDSGGGAGIQADLKTFMAHGVYGASAITAITVQNTLGVRDFEMLAPRLVVGQIEAVLDDIGADAIKTGMLGSTEVVEAVVETLSGYKISNLVVDPVMVAQSGDPLLAKDAVDAIRERLLPLALLITPNLPEAGVLLNRPVEQKQDMFDAARDLHDLGPRFVLLKGGHLPDAIVDVLYDGVSFHTLRSPRIPTRHTHGTGCTYASAITALLARSVPMEQAVSQAHNYVLEAIRHAEAIGKGVGPVHHLWRGLPQQV
ncbi:MAG: bifunctional hydroxymethylpyrimidine kinase/phosphomethylpyrimidine kinase [Chloroflexi bacterium AL-W]|nr:bifunctional hydroxymethylpyrimidine kinase/phosphomethylpyrimidine kinase [Chloroflexi bacterium AL-N1]NOK71676.1 bifunctional hydroxymethylpyrimidine kinase/phosphomethylpyrimidine kinase [Chloroflexi bacterium AL-N10]NOK79017.1 bifunctional hydroxymethylpyrimidine kinase/phosphomethylpyrimidine kinase [Chloroflexi bacterium AL-N5]NOK86451.1 bifunctional hydroxymethylpyrimidine kinase/phosphomethylpyrimidine kinase [Chloroflexi bacterium AL-W]NOK93417.1 bifunctional hydroxymethylpyrimidine